MTIRVVHTAYAWGRVTEGWMRAQVAPMDGVDLMVVAARREDGTAAVRRPPADRDGGIPIRFVDDGPAGAIYREMDRIWARSTGRRSTHAYARLVPGRTADIVHAHFGDWGYAIAPLATRIGARLIVSFYGYDAGSLPRRRGWARRLQDLFSTAACLVVEGPAMASRLEAIGGRRDRISIVPLGIDVATFEGSRPAIAREAAVFRVLVAASLREKKGVDDALRSVARAGDRLPTGWRVDVVGDGPLAISLRTLATELRLADRVQWHGYLPEPELADLLATSDVLLQPSRTAADGDTEGGAPVVLMLAAAAGVPVVATRHADIPFIVEDGRTGLLAAERDIEGLADALVAIADPGYRQRLSAEARAAAEERFTVERMRGRLAALYASVASGEPAVSER
ncbi:MAG TPA: glycosyltransferase [Candidatus Limnocylindrales bacterium]|nr:glycosyltransferase [Candidatus Limnocylindrales bacterium]